MKTLNQYLDAYGVSHRNPTNRLIHFVCVPLIFFATLGLLWCLPLGAWFGLEGAIADWVNGATVLAAVSALFYLQLSFSAALIMGGWLTVSIGGILLIAASPLPLLWTSAAIWVAAWAAQFYGHKVEGAKPSFAEDLLFLLIGPLFVVDELCGGFFTETPQAR
jgi:uncharacterized membrane protein YGL010W